MLRKINLSRAVRTMQQLFPEEYNFYPRSWIMPEEYQLFSAHVHDNTYNLLSFVSPLLMIDFINSTYVYTNVFFAFPFIGKICLVFIAPFLAF